MNKFTIQATLIRTYEISVGAEDSIGALDVIKDWIADDFEPFQTNAKWYFDVEEEAN